MDPKSKSSLLVGVGILIGIVVGAVAYSLASPQIPNGSPGFELPKITFPSFGAKSNPSGTQEVVSRKDAEKVSRFASELDFKEYLEASQQLGSDGGGGFSVGRGEFLAFDDVAVESRAFALPQASESAGATLFGTNTSATRVSNTNVQVAGIDEPDIVKTNGSEIFYSNQNYFIDIEPAPFLERAADALFEAEPSRLIAPYPQRRYGGTHVIDAFPPANLDLAATIDLSGELLLHENTLVVLGNNQEVMAYDIADKASPTARWEMDIEDNSYVVTSRLKDDSLFLVTRTSIIFDNPCPIRPLRIAEDYITVPCDSVYHPTVLSPIDVTYTVFEVDVNSGEVEESVSFVGSSGATQVYMSNDSIYITYQVPSDNVAILADFLNENTDLMPEGLVEDINTLLGYEISGQAKQTEVSVLLQRYFASLTNDERTRIENESANRMDDFMQTRLRDFQLTGIAKIPIKSFKVDSVGSVPGRLLNQFSMDEHDEHLRVATTIEPRFYFGYGLSGSAESVNDMYVLDDDMDRVGEVLNMGRDETIHSVRFLGDEGYIVTFKQIDPFYVLDLSDPRSPAIAGELKIPGFSSYLHPIAENLVLGIGREDRNVKLSMFDVSDPNNPRESAKYLLNEFWTDVQSNHHAFLHDADNEIFFMPAGQKGFIFSYDRDSISLERAVSDVRAQRALYLDNYLYVVGTNGIVVLNESDWQEVNRLKLN